MGAGVWMCNASLIYDTVHPVHICMYVYVLCVRACASMCTKVNHCFHSFILLIFTCACHNIHYAEHV